jgi:hypothetical protein
MKLACLVAAAIWLAPIGARAQAPPPADTRPLLLVVGADGDETLARSVESRLRRHILSAMLSSRPITKSFPIQQLPQGSGVDPDEDEKDVQALIAQSGAQAALLGWVSSLDGMTATRVTLHVPHPGHDPSPRAEHWTVRVKDEAVELPLATGTYRFDTVNISDVRLSPTPQQSLAGGLVGNTTRLLGLNHVPGLKQYYWEEPTTTEAGVATFVSGILAYRSGDFIAAERLFGRARAASQPGSRTRSEAAILQLASAARAVPLVAQAQGIESVWPWSRRIRKVQKLGKEIRSEYPWSIEARMVLATFYLEVAATAPDSVFKGGSWTRAWARDEAKDNLKAMEKLSEGVDPWTVEARKVAKLLED